MTASPILAAFDVCAQGPSSFSAASVVDERRPNIFGGQLLGQMIVAAARFEPAKRVKSLHTIFARTGTAAEPVDIAIEPLHNGRAFGSLDARVTQSGRLLSQGLVLLDSGEPDLIRHQIPRAIDTRPPPEAVTPATPGGPEIQIIGDVDLMTPAITGPPELHLWMRWQEVSDEPAMHQAALSWFTDPFLIGASMRPHAGIGLEQAHESISTGVISHTITFHEDFRLSDWLLISNHGLHAGGGRIYGEGHVFGEDGTLIASFVQTSMIRNFRESGGVRGKARGAM